MDTNFSKRFIDHKLIGKIIEGTEDFKERSFRVRGIKVIYYIFIIMCVSIIFVGGLIGIVKADITKVGLDYLIVSSSIILAIFVLLIFLTSVLLIGTYRSILALEFQNLLFSSGILSDGKAFMILSEDKHNIIYMDGNSRSLFKRTDRTQCLHDLIQDIKISEEEALLLFESLSKNQKFVCSTVNNQRILNFSFLPLMRPHGFYIIKLNTDNQLD